MLMMLECFSSGIRGWWLSGTVGEGHRAGPNGCSVLPKLLPPEAQCKPYYSDHSRFRLLVHHLCTSHYLDLFITGVIGLNVVTMARALPAAPGRTERLAVWAPPRHEPGSWPSPRQGASGQCLAPTGTPSCTICRDLQRSVLSWSDR